MGWEELTPSGKDSAVRSGGAQGSCYKPDDLEQAAATTMSEKGKKTDSEFFHGNEAQRTSKGHRWQKCRVDFGMSLSSAPLQRRRVPVGQPLLWFPLKSIPVASVLQRKPYGEGLKQKSTEVLTFTVFWH